MTNVSVIGTGCVKFGERLDTSYEALATAAVEEALGDAKCAREQIEAAWIGTYLPGAHGGKSGTALADPLRMYGIPISRVENFCATGTDAFRHATLAIQAGAYDVALVVGVEKMKDRPGRGLPLEGRHPIVGRGSSAPGQFALAATRYMHERKVGREVLAAVAVKNHENGAKNPLAHLQKAVTADAVLKAPMIAWPFGLYDCCPTTDGAAAAVLCRADRAREFSEKPVAVRGTGLAVTNGKPFLDPTFDYLGFPATTAAAAQAYAQAGIKDAAREIDFAEVHDCFTMTEILNYEDLGFAPRGEGWRMIMEGRTALGGDKPVNPSGGLKSFGHPIGASGVRMIYEVTRQIQRRGDARQVAKSRIGLAHNVGGPGAVSCVVVLSE
jgi:acetyl-CoA C-acetyltransferase